MRIKKQARFTVMRIDAGNAGADLETLDALARIRLIAHRQGLRVSVDQVPPGLRELAALAGLEDVLLR